MVEWVGNVMYTVKKVSAFPGDGKIANLFYSVDKFDLLIQGL